MSEVKVTEVVVGDTLLLPMRDGTSEPREVTEVKVLSVSTAITVRMGAGGSAQYVYENWQQVLVER